MTPVQKLLPRLERVKCTGPGRWIASCPTRDDRCPSLAIRELEDGRVLIHDFGGADAASIMAVVGLALADLFPDQPGRSGPPTRRPFSASDVLALVAFEAGVVVQVCSAVRRGQEVPQGDFERLLTASRRLSNAAEVCNAYR
jgi:hypothetical protein